MQTGLEREITARHGHTEALEAVSVGNSEEPCVRNRNDAGCWKTNYAVNRRMPSWNGVTGERRSPVNMTQSVMLRGHNLFALFKTFNNKLLCVLTLCLAKHKV